MLERWGVEAVAFGPSLDDEDRYLLIREYPSLEERQRSQDAFYGSDEWRQNYRDAVLPLIENYHTVLIRLTPTIRQGLVVCDTA